MSSSSSSYPQTQEQFSFSEEFKNTNRLVRHEWQIGREAAKNVFTHINELVSILHKEHPDWSIRQIGHQITLANSDLEGFSTRSIYNNLDEENRQLVIEFKAREKESQYKPSSALEEFRKTKGTITTIEKQNNVIEEKFAPLQTNVIEESSIITTTTEEQQEEEEQQQQQQEDLIYDKEFIDRILKENLHLSSQFKFDYDLEVKDQVIPLIVTVYPKQKYGHVRIRGK